MAFGLHGIRASFRHAPSELKIVTVPSDRLRRAKLVTGVRTTPLAGVTSAIMPARSPSMISSTASDQSLPAGHTSRGWTIRSGSSHLSC